MKLEDRPTKECDAKQNALITQLDSHLINHENSTLEMILLARRLERERDAGDELLKRAALFISEKHVHLAEFHAGKGCVVEHCARCDWLAELAELDAAKERP